MNLSNFEQIDTAPEVEAALAQLLDFLAKKSLYDKDLNQVQVARNDKGVLIATLNLNLIPKYDRNQIRIAVSERTKEFRSEGALTVAFYTQMEEMVAFEFVDSVSDDVVSPSSYRWLYSYDIEVPRVISFLARYLMMSADSKYEDFNLVKLIEAEKDPLSPFVHRRIRHVVSCFVPYN